MPDRGSTTVAESCLADAVWMGCTETKMFSLFPVSTLCPFSLPVFLLAVLWLRWLVGWLSVALRPQKP